MSKVKLESIIIKATDPAGTTVQFLKMASREMAELVFRGLTHDPLNQGFNWELKIGGEITDWHHPAPRNRIEAATELLANCERVLECELTRGQATDLLLDNFAWLDNVAAAQVLVSEVAERSTEYRRLV